MMTYITHVDGVIDDHTEDTVSHADSENDIEFI
jgi:hypothetical protein